MEEKNIETRCTHEQLEWIGNDEDAEFSRCVACGAVVVTQHDERIVIPALRSDRDRAA